MDVIYHKVSVNRNLVNHTVIEHSFPFVHLVLVCSLLQPLLPALILPRLARSVSQWQAQTGAEMSRLDFQTPSHHRTVTGD